MSKNATAAAQSPEAPKQVAKNPKSHAGEKIVVASKLPMALTLQLQQTRTEERRDRSTTWVETVSYFVGPRVYIHGTAFPNGDVPEDFERPQMMAGAALTFNVDRDFFEQWLAQNREFPAVKNDLIFHHLKADGVKGMARELREFDSGLGPVKHGKDKDGNDVITDKRMPKKLSAGSIRAALASGVTEVSADAE